MGVALKWARVTGRLQNNPSARFAIDNVVTAAAIRRQVSKWDDSEDYAFVDREGWDMRNHSEGIENSRQPECSSRRLGSESSDPDGVGVAHGRIPATDEGAGIAAGGFVCDASESQGSMFCRDIRPFGSNGDGHFHSRLD